MKNVFALLLLLGCAFTRLAAQEAPRNSDTLIVLGADSSCFLHLGFMVDDDEVDVFYQLLGKDHCPVQGTSLTFYDRWGKVLYKTDELSSKVWAADFKHFIWVLRYLDADKKQVILQGNLYHPWE